MKNAILICNPLAGIKSARRTQRIHAATLTLRKFGIETVINFTSKSGDGERLARSAVDKGCDLLIVCGGDGTINEVVNGMAAARTPLAILPGGTANIVARELGLPCRTERAAEQLASWQPCRISLGRARWDESGSLRQRYFFAVAGVGFDAHIINQLNLPMKHRIGVLAYGWEAVRQTFRYGFPAFQCEADSLNASATFAVIQRSSRYAGWLRLTGSQSILSPDFSVCIFRSSNRGRYLSYALGVLTQTHYRLRDVSQLRASCARCTNKTLDEAVYFEVDGEMAGQIPVTFDVVPDALTILAPRSFFASVR